MSASDTISPGSEVTYTVKELLDEQTDLLRGIDKKVDGKADKSDLTPIVVELRDHHDRLVSLETTRTETDGARKIRNRAWAIIGSVAGVAAIIIGSLIDAHVHPF